MGQQCSCGSPDAAAQELAKRDFLDPKACAENGPDAASTEDFVADKEVILAALRASEELRGNKEVVLAAVKQNGDALDFASEELLADREVIFAAVQQDGLLLDRASKELKEDRAVVLAAVQQDGRALQHAAEELRGNKEVVLAAVKQNCDALEYALEELVADREVILAAVQQDGDLLHPASEELRKDRTVVLAAVQQDGRALQYAAEDLKKERAVVLAAVQQNGFSLQFAAEELRTDRAVVLAAVQQNGGALKYGAEELRRDRAVVLAAVQQNGSALCYATEELRTDKQFLLQAVRATNAYWLFHFAADELRTDHVQGQCRAACGPGLVFTYYDTLLADICHSFPFAGASVPGGEAYDHVMKELGNPDRKGSTATVWFGDEPVWGHEAANGEWKHPSEECGRDQMPVPPVEGRDEKWLARLEGRKDSVVPQVGSKYNCWCCHWLRKVKEHHDAGEVICVAVSNIYGADWVKECGAGSSELSDEAAELHGLQKEHFRNGRPQSWGEGKIRTSEGREFDRVAKVHPRTNKPLGAGCRWERWALDQQPFPVYAFFRP